MNQETVNPDTCISQFDSSIIDRISRNIEQIKAGLQRFIDHYHKNLQKSYKMLTLVMKIIESISDNHFNGSHIFTDDLNKSLQIIDTAFEAYSKDLFYFRKLKQQKKSIINFEKDMENFSQIIEIFASAIEEIVNEIKNETDENKIELIKLRLGLESTLFNISVNIESRDQKPYQKSSFVEMYKFHNVIFNMKENMIGIESVCGTGKTVYLPIILLCKNMRGQFDSPFLIITQPTPKHIEPKEEYFKKTISKYVTVVSDPDELFEMYNEYEKTKKISKFVLALLTPHNMLPLMHRLEYNKIFYPCTRFVFDEVHQRTFHLDVLISQFGKLSKENVFQNELHVILTSASISPEMLTPFYGKMQKTQLIKSPPFEIIEWPPIIEEDIQKINNEIVPDQTINIIKEMSKLDSDVNEGHILCFLSGIVVCFKLKNAVITMFKNSEETKSQRKIVILQTTLKPRETIESYLSRLNEEFTFNEGLREGKKYKNDFLYFVPIVLNGLADDAIYELAQKEFPGDLKKINKLICSTPMIESSFTIDRLSVVVDSGIVKEAGFDICNCLPTLTEKQASKESMNQRKGRLGRTMKGVYISIHAPNEQIIDIQTPPIQRTDLTTNILSMKDISIDFENIKNLPSIPNKNNLTFSMLTLKRIKAIDKKSRITPFGHGVLKYINIPYITVYYASAIANFITKFKKEEKKYAAFFAAYISNIIAMDNLIIEEDMSEKMSRLFDENSDITTLINSFNILLKSGIKDNDQLRNLVESYGFSYSNYVVFKDYLQKVVEIHSPGTSIESFITSIDDFVSKNNGIANIVDNFIPCIAKAIPNWTETHSIKLKYVNGAGGFDSRPTIIFNGDPHLCFNYQKKFSEVFISKRPGWNGITIPTDCYCFNISRNSNLEMNFGHLIHRKNKDSRGEIVSIECSKVALNPWFNVLLDTYLKDSNLNIKYFTNKTNRLNTIERRMFHYSNTGERVFVSFIPYDQWVKQFIINSINECLKLMPFIPKSVLIYRDDIQSIIEVTSIGTEHYETTVSTDVHGDYLNWKSIVYCLKHIEELSKSNSSIRICSLFTNNSCKLNDYDRKNLYIIEENSSFYPPLIDVVKKRARNVRNNTYNSLYNCYNRNSLELFQFPTKFIHPALLYHQQILDSIMEWFTEYCSYAKVVKVIGHRFLMSRSDIMNLQNHLHKEKERIKEEMKLNYVAIPVPGYVYSKGYKTIKEHLAWEYNKRYKVIITTKEESEEVNKFINSIKSANDEQEQQIETLCCLYICDDPDDPVLTNYPITIYNEDGTTYTNKMCRNCLVETLKVSTESYYSNGMIDQDALTLISDKPSVIPSVTSKETKNGLECWPQIPLGQMISALISNDDELSELVTVWLQGVSEYTVRMRAKDLFTFCPYHPQRLFKLGPQGHNNHKCNLNRCSNIFCDYCMGWHDSKYICDEKKSGKFFVWPTKCPKCKVPTFKDGGCNHITCKCGCHWCYKCGEGFTSADRCYSHLSAKHGGCFDYNFD